MAAEDEKLARLAAARRALEAFGALGQPAAPSVKGRASLRPDEARGPRARKAKAADFAELSRARADRQNAGQRTAHDAARDAALSAALDAYGEDVDTPEGTAVAKSQPRFSSSGLGAEPTQRDASAWTASQRGLAERTRLRVGAGSQVDIGDAGAKARSHTAAVRVDTGADAGASEAADANADVDPNLHDEASHPRPPLELSASAARQHLLVRALRMLALRELSQLELMRKLKLLAARIHIVPAMAGQAGEELLSCQVQSVIDECAASGYQSNARFAENLARRREKFGSAKLVQELKAHRIDADDGQQAVLDAQAGDLERALAGLRKRFGRSEKQEEAARQHARYTRFLIARGFSSEVVHRAIRQFKLESGPGPQLE